MLTQVSRSASISNIMKSDSTCIEWVTSLDSHLRTVRDTCRSSQDKNKRIKSIDSFINFLYFVKPLVSLLQKWLILSFRHVVSPVLYILPIKLALLSYPSSLPLRQHLSWLEGLLSKHILKPLWLRREVTLMEEHLPVTMLCSFLLLFLLQWIISIFQLPLQQLSHIFTFLKLCFFVLRNVMIFSTHSLWPLTPTFLFTPIRWVSLQQVSWLARYLALLSSCSGRLNQLHFSLTSHCWLLKQYSRKLPLPLQLLHSSFHSPLSFALLLTHTPFFLLTLPLNRHHLHSLSWQ